LQREISACMGKKIHPVKIPADFVGPGQDDRLLHVFEHAQLADLKKSEHAVGIDERGITEVNFFRMDEGAQGLLKSLFGKLGHPEIGRGHGAWCIGFCSLLSALCSQNAFWDHFPLRPLSSCTPPSFPWGTQH